MTNGGSRGRAKLAEEAVAIGAVRPGLNTAAVPIGELGPVKVPDDGTVGDRRPTGERAVEAQPNRIKQQINIYQADPG